MFCKLSENYFRGASRYYLPKKIDRVDLQPLFLVAFFIELIKIYHGTTSDDAIKNEQSIYIIKQKKMGLKYTKPSHHSLFVFQLKGLQLSLM